MMFLDARGGDDAGDPVRDRDANDNGADRAQAGRRGSSSGEQNHVADPSDSPSQMLSSVFARWRQDSWHELRASAGFGAASRALA